MKYNEGALVIETCDLKFIKIEKFSKKLSFEEDLGK